MELNVKYLRAAVIVASKEETRYYLKGVAVQAGDKGAFIVATDGHRAMAFRQSAEAQAPVDIIIPAGIIAGITVNKHVERAHLTCVGENLWRIDYGSTSVVFSPIDGTFPDWRRVVPKEISGETAQFNPSYVGDFAKVAKALAAKGDCVKIAHNGGGPALVTFGDDIDGFGLLMPTRANQASTVWDSAPSWATV